MSRPTARAKSSTALRELPGTVLGGDIRVLLIEDNPGDARLIREMLVHELVSFELEWEQTLRVGLDRLAGGAFDLVLLDLTLPESTGLETFDRVVERAPDIPVVVLSGLSDENLAVRAVNAGAQDYLVKGLVDQNLLVRSVRYAIERKRAEVELQESNARLREAQAIAHLGGWEWYPATDSMTWSEELYRILGLEPRSEAMPLDSYVSRVHPEDRAETRRKIDRALRERVPFDFEERVVRPDGTVRVLRTQGEPTMSEAGDVVRVFGACLDVTERKQAELELAAARDAALQSVRLKSAFIANMSHEIRTPLNIILGYTDVISSDFEVLDGETRATLIDGVRRAGDRLMTTIDGILDISKMETGNFEIDPVSLDLAAMIEKVIDDFRVLARDQGLTLSFENEVPGACVRFDEYCLSHALMNLLQNAIKFTRQGGVVVRIAREPGGNLCLEVEDSGVGIESAYLARLFEPFSQEESGYTRRFEGSGLGLALTRNYVELNHATIDVESVKGEGSTFRIRFAPDDASAPDGPAVPEAETQPVSGTRSANGGARPSVLVVEDDPDTQAYMRIILEKRYDVRVAASGKEMRRQIEEADGLVAVLMDLSLRGEEDGLVLTRYLREQERFRNLAIIVTTAHAFPEDRARALEAGCDAYLAKPIDRHQLLGMMNDLAESGPLRGS